jgi:hypothetical protein
MALETISRHEVGDDVWDATVRRARQRHFFFETAYIDYHADRFADASLVVMSKGRPIAALPASRHGNEIRSHGGLTFGGLLLDASAGAERALEAVEAGLARWRDEGATDVVVKPAPHIYHLAPAEEELFAWYSNGAVLDDRKLAQAIRNGSRYDFSKGRAGAIKRGRESGVRVGKGDGIEEFMTLVGELLARRHDAEPVHTAAEMRRLADSFPDEIKLFEARDDGRLVAGVLVFETPCVAHTQYIASSVEGQELKAQDALLAHLVEDVYADKPWFDFGTSNERDGTLNLGLVLNKEGYGARSVAYDSYRLSL